MVVTNEEIKKRFSEHHPTDSQKARQNLIRNKCIELALLISAETPISREQALSLTHLESTAIYAIRAITQNE
jgi:hypothetical protein